MTKFFAQLLVSVMVSISAAVGLGPHVKDVLSDSWAEAKTFLNEKAEGIIGMDRSVDTNVNLDLTLESEFDAGRTGKSNAEVDAGVDLDAELDDVYNVLPESTANGSAEAEVDAKAELGETELDLEGSIESGLEIILGN
jgi:hypothetical protein